MIKSKGKTAEELLQEVLVPEEEQPYTVPDNWVWVKLGNISVIKRGASPRPKGDPKYFNGLIPWLKISDVTKQGKYIYETEDTVTKEGKGKSVWVEPDTIVLSISASVGRPAITKVGVCIHDGFVKIEENKEIINKEYLYYYLVAALNRMLNKAKGAAQVNINSEVVKNLEVALPPITEQKRIADKVERLLNKINQAKQLIEEAKETFELRRAAILDKAFRGEFSATWRKVNKNFVLTNIELRSTKHSLLTDQDIPHQIPKSWRWVRLGEIFKITSGGTPSRAIPQFYNGEIPWIKTGEIKWSNIDDSDEKVSEEAILNSSAKLLPVNTVLVAMYGQGLTRGRAAILQIEATCNQAVCALLPNEYVIPKFLFYYFMEGYHRFRRIAQGGNQENLSGSLISGFAFPLPPLEEQQVIVDYLDELLEIENNVQKLLSFDKESDLLISSILNEAFRGKLGTNDMNDESAFSLIKNL